MALKLPVVSIDEHPMWIYAVDGQYIQLQLADTIFMYNSESYCAMVQFDKLPSDYTIRVANSGADQIISGHARFLTRTEASATHLCHTLIIVASIHPSVSSQKQTPPRSVSCLFARTHCRRNLHPQSWPPRCQSQLVT